MSPLFLTVLVNPMNKKTLFLFLNLSHVFISSISTHSNFEIATYSLMFSPIIVTSYPSLSGNFYQFEQIVSSALFHERNKYHKYELLTCSLTVQYV